MSDNGVGKISQADVVNKVAMDNVTNFMQKTVGDALKKAASNKKEKA